MAADADEAVVDQQDARATAAGTAAEDESRYVAGQ